MDTNLPLFPGRLAVQQRVLPAYRLPFFDVLAQTCRDGLSVFAGQPGRDEAIHASNQLEVVRYTKGRNLHLGKVSSPIYICWQIGLLRWLEDWQPDALVVEANPRYMSTRLAVNWMRRRQRPVLGWGLGAPEAALEREGILSGIRQAGRKRFFDMFDGMIAYSRRGAAEYCSAGFPAERVYVALNSVAGKPQTRPAERQPGFAGRPVVLFVGRLQRRKRIDPLLRACAELPAAIQPKLWIVGEGPERERLVKLAGEIYPLAIFPGEKHGADVEPFYAEADLFVLPGTGGLAVQQAMAHGLPVIAAEGDGTQEDLVRPENGWRLPPGDQAALSAALQAALSDPAGLRRMGSKSYQIVMEEANIEAMANAFVEALNAVRRG